MDISELVGFIVSLFFFFFLFFKKVLGERRRQSQPNYEDEQEKKEKENLKQFLKTLDIELEDEKDEPELALPPPPPVKVAPKPKYSPPVQSHYAYVPNKDAYQQKSAFETRRLQTAQQVGLDERSSVSAHYKDVSTVYATQKEKPSRAKKIVDALKSKKDMVILQEIIRPPLSRRSYDSK